MIPTMLRLAIPGCQSLDKVSDTELTAKVKAKVGPVNATFNGKVTLGDLNPPASYTISGEGSGGVAGFARGGAKVDLTEDGPDATTLRYDAKADVGGKLAQIGSRMVQGTARKMADEFFGNFSRIVGESAARPAPAAPDMRSEPRPAEAAPHPRETPPPAGTVAPPSEAAPPPRETAAGGRTRGPEGGAGTPGSDPFGAGSGAGKAVLAEAPWPGGSRSSS